MIRKLLNRITKTSVEQAVERAALLQGEHTFATVMYDYYSATIANIDPYKDHWAFAEIRQKRLDHFDDMARLARSVDEAQAKVKATKEATSVSAWN